jgi:hypothetical protein
MACESENGGSGEISQCEPVMVTGPTSGPTHGLIEEPH